MSTLASNTAGVFLRPDSILRVDESIERIARISRTLSGVSNTDVSAMKEKLTLDGEALAYRARANFRGTIFYILDVPFGSVRSDECAQLFLMDTHRCLNLGLEPKNFSQFRSWETNIAGHAPASRVIAEFQDFASEFKERWQQQSSDPITFAAWMEQRSNSQGHFFYDGCGRLARAFSVAALARAGLRYPVFESREEYFRLIGQSNAQWTKDYTERML